MRNTKYKTTSSPCSLSFTSPSIEGDGEGVASKNSNGFTLVELIVVVTILAILATIGFVSYSSYLIGVRDTNRIAQMTSLSDGLNLYSTTNDLPIPEDNVEVSVNDTLIAYQGYAGANILETINFDKGGLDPKDNTYFSYYLTRDRKYFQMMGFLEESADLTTQHIFTNKTNAVNFQDRIPTVTGKKLGILTDTDNTPIQEIVSGELNLSTTTDDYIARVSNTYIINGNGNQFSILEDIQKQGGGLITSCASILRKYPKSKDGFYRINPSSEKTFEVYCDMTVAGGGWTLAVATYYAGGSDGVGHIAGANSYGDVNDATTGVNGNPGGRYKLHDEDIKAIQDLSSKTDSSDYLFNQIGYNTYYSGGNNEYLTLENYTAEWNYGGIMLNSTTPFTVTSYRRSDGKKAIQGTIPANVGCGLGEFGINCSLASYFGSGGGANCDIDLRTSPATDVTWSGPFYTFMENTNADTYLYACNGAQHSSTNRYKSRYFIRETN